MPVVKDEMFRIKKYRMKEGDYHTWHVDHHSPQSGETRHLALVLYLNDVSEGGETEINEGVLMRPQAGHILFFPTGKDYLHRAKPPLSRDKYVVTNFITD